MSREVLLAAIRANPAEDLPRLLYADWLAEHGAGDLDAATVEFVRVACDCRAGGRPKGPSMPPRAYRWLHVNWPRLLPSVVGMHRAVRAVTTPAPAPLGYFAGRLLRWWVWVADEVIGPMRYRVTVTFGRGFVARFATRFPWPQAVLGPLVTADQPLAELSWAG